jgi:hypothetical protein
LSLPVVCGSVWLYFHHKRIIEQQSL